MELRRALEATYPELSEVAAAAAGMPVYLVGGAVRDLLLGRGRADIDLVVVGDATALAARLDAETVAHERFATAKAHLAEHDVDIASARAESYPRPGSLPEVEPADSIETDLARRDFTVNAMAVPLQDEPRLVDPHGGRGDLDAGVLRVLHDRSFADDPTRALRAARYAARLGFRLAPQTEALLRDADLSTVSSERRRAELLRLADEETALRGLELLDAWGLVPLQPGGLELARRVEALLRDPPWEGIAERAPALLAAAQMPPGGSDLPLEPPRRPSQGVELAGDRRPLDLLLARARGAEWLDRYLAEWRDVALEIDGADLIAAGVPQGPTLGHGLATALRRKLDGEVDGRDEELAAALSAARGG